VPSTVRENTAGSEAAEEDSGIHAMQFYRRDMEGL
jgi:hypothetical protein